MLQPPPIACGAGRPGQAGGGGGYSGGIDAVAGCGFAVGRGGG